MLQAPDEDGSNVIVRALCSQLNPENMRMILVDYCAKYLTQKTIKFFLEETGNEDAFGRGNWGQRFW